MKIIQTMLFSFLALSLALLGMACGENSTITAHSQSISTAALTNEAAADLMIGQKSPFAHTSAQTDAGGFKTVTDIAIANNRLYIADNGNMRVLGYADATALANGAEADIVINQDDFFTTDYRNIPAEQEIQPTGVEVDAEGRVYIYNSSKVLVYNDPFDESTINGLGDTLMDYTLKSLPPSIQTIRSMPNNKLAVVGTTLIVFYERGSDTPYSLGDIKGGSTGLCTFADIAEVSTNETLIVCQSGADCDSDTWDCHCAGAAMTCACPPPSILVTCSCDLSCACDTGLNKTCSGIYVCPKETSSGFVENPDQCVIAYTGFGKTYSAQISTDRLMVADHNSNRVLRFSGVQTHVTARLTVDPSDLVNAPATRAARPAPTTYTTPIADLVYGQPDFTTTGANYHDTLNGQISEQGLSSPKKLKLDTSRRMWVVDSSNRRILNFEDIAANTANTLPALVLGQANFSQGYNNRLEAEALVTPRGLVLTSGSTISAYIVDEATHRILVFDDVQSLKDGEAPSRVLGQPNDLSYTKNAGADLTSISGSGLDTPSHIAWDNTNSVLYVTDKNHKRILAYQSLGSGTLTATSVFGAPNMGAAGTLYSFGALAVYDTTLYAAAGNRIFVYNTTQASEDPEKVFGQPYPYTPPLEIGEVISNTCNHGGIGADSLCEVQGLAVDEDGTLWVADTGNDRVLWFDNPTDSDLLAARTADGVVGQPDFVSNGDHAGTGSNRRYGFKDVRGIALNTLPGTNEQQLWAVDTSNHRVLRFSNPKDHALNTELQQADLVLGQADLSSYDSNGGTGVSEYGFYSPQYISIDEHAKVLLVSDTGNHRVMRFILNDAPVLTGGGTFDIVEGDSAVVELSASDPNGDTLDFALLDPVALGGTLSSLTLSFVSDGYKAGDTVSFTVVATDQNTNPKSASASVVFNIISRPQEVTEGTPPAARPDVRTEASCNCSGMGGISLLPWLLIAWFGRFSLRRRR